MLDAAIQATAIIGVLYIAVSFVLHAIQWTERYATLPKPVAPRVPELGPECDGEALAAELERVSRQGGVEAGVAVIAAAIERPESNAAIVAEFEEITPEPVDWTLWSRKALIGMFPKWGVQKPAGYITKDGLVALVEAHFFRQVVREYC